jgi:hypothetical protein
MKKVIHLVLFDIQILNFWHFIITKPKRSYSIEYDRLGLVT